MYRVDRKQCSWREYIAGRKHLAVSRFFSQSHTFFGDYLNDLKLGVHYLQFAS